ncbi:leucine-rich repeat extensin-like protein 5 [Phragmites australis]|uniref:leucine-rich repeat extensin-like protein 5 n=1 Tax=Phragmites australis TaxID=29695 RepID=UPI002D7970AF|nr:leucine-rich repeat extensin-like protein 5 [Phragmites australis]
MLNHSDSRPPFLHGPTHAAEGSLPSPASEPRDWGTAQRMDAPSSSGRPTTPRRPLQGQRPPRLNVRMESHTVKKPSGAGAGAGAPAQAQGLGRREPGPPPRAPVIIYDASPKVIHANPSEFMALVQRLTGPGSGGPSPAEAQQEYHTDEAVLGQAPFLPPELLLSPSTAMSPAARLATIERSVRPTPAPAPDYVDVPDGSGVDDGTLAAVLGPARQGILSPLPSSLPPAAASGLFSPPPFDPSCISWLNELSPILRAASTAGAPPSGFCGGGPSNGASRPLPSYYADPFVPSPRNLLATPTVPSPTTCAEFFGSLPDL